MPAGVREQWCRGRALLPASAVLSDALTHMISAADCPRAPLITVHGARDTRSMSSPETCQARKGHVTRPMAAEGRESQPTSVCLSGADSLPPVAGATQGRACRSRDPGWAEGEG